VVSAGAVDQGSEDAGCGVGDGCPDGGLLLVGPVQALDAKCGVKGFADGVRGIEQVAGGVGQFVKQGGVVFAGWGGGEGVELGLGGGTVGVRGVEAVADAGPVGVGGGTGVGAELGEFGHQALFGGFQPGDGGAELVCLAVAAFGFFGGGGGQFGGERSSEAASSTSMSIARASESLSCRLSLCCSYSGR
jgi:hypothetical protein